MQILTDLEEASQLLSSVRGRPLDREERVSLAVELAEKLLDAANKGQTSREHRLYEELFCMAEDPRGRIFVTNLADQCFRSKTPSVTASMLSYLVDKYGIPDFLPPLQRLQLQGFRKLAKALPAIFVPIAQAMLRKSMSMVVVPDEKKALKRHLLQRRSKGVRSNLNHLGEAIHGEKEAQNRLTLYLNTLSRDEVEYISVKISTLYSQINRLDWKETLLVLSERLRLLYRQAMGYTYERPDGRVVQKFVNLDMEEYKDLPLTLQLFKQVLDEEEFLSYSAGIVLQSYLPDCFPLLQELTSWALDRQKRGGAPIKVRIVKGANLVMEQIESSLLSWPQPCYKTKKETDANYKRMVEWACRPDHAEALHVGIASHNLFDIAYAFLLRAENGLEEQVSFEMLEGMANHLARAVQELAGDVLLYCPTATIGEYHNAIAYLIRRLDENMGGENFIRHSFALTTDSPVWEKQSQLFSEACHAVDTISSLPRRTQDRATEKPALHVHTPFDNEPNTDFSLETNRQWAEEIVTTWQPKRTSPLPLLIGGKEVYTKNCFVDGRDPSRPQENPYYLYSLAEWKHADKALDQAKKAEKGWSSLAVESRSAIFADVAKEVRAVRNDLIGALVGDGGKTIPEADGEVSEAIDFIEYYRRNLEELHSFQDLSWRNVGTVFVASPWNFPCAISCGGIASGLLAGNSVIYKPSKETVLVGWILANAFWRGGVPKKVLQFLPSPSATVGNAIVRDPRCDAVILTGATETALNLLKERPGLQLSAETGGKNAIIITGSCDRDLAIHSLVYSAFGHAGQKCSAASLAICLKEVYDDAHFMGQLVDATTSLHVGSAWDLKTKIPPLIRPPDGALLRGLTTLEKGEKWLLEPKVDSDNPHLWHPGIRIGVKEGSFTHQTELFGPHLSVMRAQSLDHAMRLVNATRYGLTTGLQTLDERDHDRWLNGVNAGNYYINREITGAIVRRQPFGGIKASSFGQGAKAGGPNYLMQIMTPSQRCLPQQEGKLSEQVVRLDSLLAMLSEEESEEWTSSVNSYAYWWEQIKEPQDLSLLQGQDNFFLYMPRKHNMVRVQIADRLVDLAKLCAAALTCSAPLIISWDEQTREKLQLLPWLGISPIISFMEEKPEHFVGRVKSGDIKRVRTLSAPSKELLSAASQSGAFLLSRPPLANGRVELVSFLREASLSVNYHRYGDLGNRAWEPRKPII
ncbi:proline dehydrogenase family protein [Simkania negevensis]|uniref:L-glutamate gamma-semialdehyde dehydrogenase n=1 Tax=Simkania negevensis TaxID=83561 RepID=A0ABS3AS34_9BACT|nr:proline dehydrogenase family protein [Simkania negevensis]